MLSRCSCIRFLTPRRTNVRFFRYNRNRQHRESTESFETPFQDTCIDVNQLKFRNLWKPLCYTVGVGSACFLGATIWEYERIRAKAIQVLKKPKKMFKSVFKKKESKEPTVWNHVQEYWNNLSHSDRLFVGIAAINVAVFCGWRCKPLQSFMFKYFSSNPGSQRHISPMLLSVFSHYSMIHLGMNMYILHSFSNLAVHSMGVEQFLAVYLTGGVVASFFSYFYKIIVKQPSLSLGASGAILAILGYICSEFPDTKLGIIFVPNFAFTANTAMAALIALDTVGVLLKWKYFDHAAHLGGLLFGIFWARWGVENVWQKREPVLRYWHNIRGSIK